MGVALFATVTLRESGSLPSGMGGHSVSLPLHSTADYHSTGPALVGLRGACVTLAPYREKGKEGGGGGEEGKEGREEGGEEEGKEEREEEWEKEGKKEEEEEG